MKAYFVFCFAFILAVLVVPATSDSVISLNRCAVPTNGTWVEFEINLQNRPGASNATITFIPFLTCTHSNGSAVINADVPNPYYFGITLRTFNWTLLIEPDMISCALYARNPTVNPGASIIGNTSFSTGLCLGTQYVPVTPAGQNNVTFGTVLMDFLNCTDGRVSFRIFRNGTDTNALNGFLSVRKPDGNLAVDSDFSSQYRSVVLGTSPTATTVVSFAGLNNNVDNSSILYTAILFNSSNTIQANIQLSMPFRCGISSQQMMTDTPRTTPPPGNNFGTRVITSSCVQRSSLIGLRYVTTVVFQVMTSNNLTLAPLACVFGGDPKNVTNSMSGHVLGQNYTCPTYFLTSPGLLTLSFRVGSNPSDFYPASSLNCTAP